VWAIAILSESLATERRDDVILEVLNLVEIAAPVQWAVGQPTPAAKIDRVA